MLPEPVFFARPEGPALTLKVVPQLASWNAAGHPDQRRLATALGHAEDLLGPYLNESEESWALRLDIGLPETVKLLDHHDLDNYLFPLSRRLIKNRNLPLRSVWATKAAGETSSIRCEPASAHAAPDGVDYRATIYTTASARTRVFKQQIRDQLAGCPEMAAGPVSLEISFAVGSRRNWVNLWKPTIDALGGLLGWTRPDREWHPRDGRITELGLHRTIEPALGSDVVIALAARALSPQTTVRPSTPTI